MTYDDYLDRSVACADAAQASRSANEREKWLLSAIAWHDLAVTERNKRRFNDPNRNLWGRWPASRHLN
jgi:hypothetical protein